MAKTKKKNMPKTQELIPTWPFNLSDFDRTFDNFRRDFERAFASFPSISTPHIPRLSNTQCDIVDEGDKLTVKVDVPGVDKKDINLNVTDNAIEISAEHSKQEEEKKKNFLRKERSQVSFYRTLPLPEKVVSGKAKAKLADGVLNIVIPKTTPTKKSKKTSVKIQ